MFADTNAHIHFAPDKMQKNNVFTTDHLFCDVYCFEPGQAQSPHSHGGSDKIYYVIDGTARVQVGSQEREATRGTIVLAPAGALHAITNAGPGRLVVLVVMAPKPS